MIGRFFGPGGPAPMTIDTERRETVTGEFVLVQALSGWQWRVCDGRRAEDDPCRLLGFIEERNDRFEVMHPEAGLHWVSLPTLAQAVDHIIQQHTDDGPVRPV